MTAAAAVKAKEVADWSEQLRAPFPPEQIGKLPKITCRDCSKSSTKVCGKHNKNKCAACGNFITQAHIHLDFVGHANVTDRFLSVDPEWVWEPVAWGDDGLPKFDQYGGLWMWLTIKGVRRLGYGDAAGKEGPDAVKESIGDGLRNAGMRFGVGLALWAKNDLSDTEARQKDEHRDFDAEAVKAGFDSEEHRKAQHQTARTWAKDNIPVPADREPLKAMFGGRWPLTVSELAEWVHAAEAIANPPEPEMAEVTKDDGSTVVVDADGNEFSTEEF